MKTLILPMALVCEDSGYLNFSESTCCTVRPCIAVYMMLRHL